MYIENINLKLWTFYDSDEIEIRLPFYRSFSTFANTLIMVYIWWSLHSSFLFIGMGWEVTWSHFCHKIKSCKHIQPQPKYKTRNFSKFNKEKISQRNLLKPETNWNLEVLLHAKHYNTAEWISCLYFFQFNNNLACIVTWCKQRFKSFWWMYCWMCTIMNLFFLRGQ